MKAMLVMFFMSTSVAFASGGGLDKIIDTQDSVRTALDKFEASQSHQVVDAYEGVKAWPVSGGMKVKIYVDGGNSVNYSCHRHEANEPFECH